jgi:uncharacterized protein (DUF952 family)
LIVYKICSRDAWNEARTKGELGLSGADARDGFVHLSAAHQVRGTLAMHFAKVADLVLLAVDVDRLAPGTLRWEISRGDDRFPHLYDRLRPEHVVREMDLPIGADGEHVCPEEI